MRSESAMSVFRAIESRRAVRSYQPIDVDAESVHKLLQAAVQAPTAIHLEPWAFAIIQDRARLRRYSDRAKALVREDAASFRTGTPGAHAERHIALLEDPRYNIFYDAGTLAAICAQPLGPFAAADCWLAAENLMLAACAMGFGTCCIGFAVRVLNQPEVKAELDIPDDVTVVAPIIIGVPRDLPPAVSRKPPVILSWK